MKYAERSKNTQNLFLRIPKDLKEQLRQASEDSGRSVNSECIQRLRRSLEGYRR